MWQIIKNEWLYLSRTKLLIVISFVFVLVLLLSIILGKYETQQQQQSYDDNLTASSTAAPAPAAHNAEGKLTGASFLLFPTNQQKTHTVAIYSLYTIWH